MRRELDNLFKFIKTSNVLFLNIDKPSWANARGYVFEKETKVLYFPVLNRYLKDKDLKKFQVKVKGSRFKHAILTGILSSATENNDIEKVFNYLVKQSKWSEQKARYSLFDVRNGKPRKGRFKLKIVKVLFSDPGFYGDKDLREIKLT